jgi:hypothetical protein
MSKVSMSTVINGPADEVWKLLRDFNGLPRFIAAIAKSTLEGSGVGAVRTLTLDGGGPPILEKLESLDEKAQTLCYSIVTSPLPVDGYFATVELKELGPGKCELHWGSTFEPKGVPEAEAVKIIEGVYAGAFEGLKGIFGG